MVLEITGIGAQMQGVGRAEDGRVVFVPFALPGEQVDVEITRETDRFWEGKIKTVLRPAPERVVPVCNLYGRCGGCRAQHMSYQCSLDLKRQVIRQQVERIGGQENPNVLPTIGSEKPWRYRNKGEFAVATDPLTRTPVVGVREIETNAILPLDDCMIQNDVTVQAVSLVAKWMQIYCISAWDDPGAQCGVRYVVTRVNRAGDLMLILSTEGKTLPSVNPLYDMLTERFGAKFRSLYQVILSKKPAHALDGKCQMIRGKHVLYDQLMGLSFEMSPKTFFQVNNAQTEVLYECVCRAAALTGNELVIDAYCGCGTISLVLARSASRVIGVELNDIAISNAWLNAKRNKLEGKTEFHTGDAGTVIVDMLRRGIRPDVMVVDPPRKGVDSGLIEAVLKTRVPRLIYVSCNPGTLARDVRRLTEEGIYRLEFVQPVDMFSQTEHVESVSLLTLAH